MLFNVYNCGYVSEYVFFFFFLKPDDGLKHERGQTLHPEGSNMKEKTKGREKQYLPVSSEGSSAAKRERSERFTQERRKREAEK